MRFYVTLICTILSSVVLGQDLKIIPSFGIARRTDSYKFPQFKKTEQYFLEPPFIGGGFIGLNAGAVLTYNKWGLEYHPNFRFGKVTERWIREGNRLYHKFEKDWLVDHEFGLFYKRDKIKIGVGYSIFNDNARYDYVRQGQEMVQNAEYDAINVYTTLPFKTWFDVEFKLYYARDGDPNDPRHETWMFGLRVFKELYLTKEDKD